MRSSHTLLDLFEPPTDMVGQLALLSALSASDDFLESALVAFTRLAPRRRESLGQPFFFLLLDGHQTDDRTEILKPNQVPGVHEFWPRADRQKDLLHAKVGLLRFGRSRSGAPSLLRVVVTTGNWTQASAKEQLELAWQLDVPIVDGDPDGPWLDRSDLRQVALFFSAVLERFAVPLPLAPALERLLSLAQKGALEWRSSRFIHTLVPNDSGTSIYELLVKKAPHDKGHPRDLLICASGFYEQPAKGGGKPEVIAKLEELPGLRPRARFALARKSDAGAISQWNAEEDGWTVIEAIDPILAGRGAERSLHAKFIYVGRKWGGSARDGWLYIGSGNLTRRGLLLAPGSDAHGNVEAGVIIELDETLDAAALASRLFVDMNAAPLETAELNSGYEDEEKLLAKPVIKTPPVLLAREHVDDDGSRWLVLFWSEGETPDFVIVNWPGKEFVRMGRTDRLSLVGPCPPTILVQSNGIEFCVAVMDASGRLSRIPLQSSSFDDALADILNFPAPPAEQEDDREDLEEDNEPGGGEARRGAVEDDQITYPLQEAMDLIEGIAAHHSSIPYEQLTDWFRHLESRLVERFTAKRLRDWSHLEFPLLKTLARPEFSPAEMSAEDSQEYLKMLERIQLAWAQTS